MLKAHWVGQGKKKKSTLYCPLLFRLNMSHYFWLTWCNCICLELQCDVSVNQYRGSNHIIVIGRSTTPTLVVSLLRTRKILSRSYSEWFDSWSYCTLEHQKPFLLSNCTKIISGCFHVFICSIIHSVSEYKFCWVYEPFKTTEFLNCDQCGGKRKNFKTRLHGDKFQEFLGWPIQWLKQCLETGKEDRKKSDGEKKGRAWQGRGGQGRGKAKTDEVRERRGGEDMMQPVLESPAWCFLLSALNARNS